jgi:hypothetical protein
MMRNRGRSVPQLEAGFAWPQLAGSAYAGPVFLNQDVSRGGGIIIMSIWCPVIRRADRYGKQQEHHEDVVLLR